MPLAADILDRKQTHFVLWHPKPSAQPPTLVIGTFTPGNPPRLDGERRIALTREAGFPDLFTVPAGACGLVEGSVYHYWFEVGGIRSTDPFAFTVDWRLRAPKAAGQTADDRQPAAVIKYRGGKLIAADPGGEEPDMTGDVDPSTLPLNNRLVIYEMPTAWAELSTPSDLDIGVGTFRDVQSLIDKSVNAANFDGLDVTSLGNQYLVDLGVNAIELLPPADSFFKRDWGYDTSHFLAPDTELGFPAEFSSPTANHDLAVLIKAGHAKGIRFFIDVVMAFARHEPYQSVNFDDFYIADPAADLSDPDSHTSRGTGKDFLRYGFGSTLFRYAKLVDGYDPIAGTRSSMFPARQLMYTYITRWARDFHIDGVRMDSVENVSNWDFVGGFKDRARELFRERCSAAGVGTADADSRFLVVGEELNLPLTLLTQGRLDGLWNDNFRGLVRSIILGEGDASSFESNVRRAIDCRLSGFADGAQAINYITSHDVEGYRRERLYNFLANNGVSDWPRRTKLAFACLLTAVGIPMMLAGEEFADEHDRFDPHGAVTQGGGKQVDPVNYSRLEDSFLDEANTQPDWMPPLRRDVLAYVTRLIHLRTSHPALGVNDTSFIHIDFNNGKRVLVWQRGQPDNPVVVIANFSDFATENAGNDSARYVVSNWPPTPPGRHWREVSQARDVPDEWIGLEPIFPWEAKIYQLR